MTRIAYSFLATSLLTFAPPILADNFTTRTDATTKFGVHEIVLAGDGTVANPFDTIATVTFTPASGAKNAKTVHAFHDGDSTWRARVYVSESGKWSWFSQSITDKGLDGKKGTFTAADSKLRGRLLIHPKNPRQWITEDGRWFLNVVDTAYFLLGPKDESGQPIPDDDMAAYVRDAVSHGVTSFLAYAVPGPGSWAEEGNWTETYFADAGFTRLRLDNFRFSDRRLRWLLDHHPDVGLEMILFPRGVRHGRDEQFWKKLTVAQKERILRFMVARYAAFPQIFWLIANDAHYGKDFPNNNAFVREVGAYFRKHDPWQHPMSTGHARRVAFHFGEEDWATYLHLEDAYDVAADQYAKYHRFAKPVLLGEDQYEQDNNDREPTDMRYFQRRLYWAWLLSGGSANYGGRWWVVHPYSETGKRPTTLTFLGKSRTYTSQLVGLDSVRFIRDYFPQRNIELSDFEPDHALVNDPNVKEATRAPKLMRRGQEEFLIYHPNAAADGQDTKVDALKTAQLKVDLRVAQGLFVVEWYRAHDGVAQTGGKVEGGDWRELTAPWRGHDVVLRLKRATTYESHDHTAPYPASKVITGIAWSPKETIIRKAKGSDNWPLTWADDDHLYTAYGDGNGFEPFVPDKLSLGIARVEGSAEKFAGMNIREETIESKGQGKDGKKASGMLCVDSVLYLWARNVGNAQLAWSKDHGQTWEWADWKFTTSFGCPTFLNFGRNYAGARDEFVYVYSHNADSAYTPADRMVLARVPKVKIRERDAYEFFQGLDEKQQPLWTKGIADRGGVFSHKGRCYRSGITYNAGLKRYHWVQIIPGTEGKKADTRFEGGFAIYDAPEPWGPWTTVFFTEKWDVGPGETSSFPTKWMSKDGKSLSLVFSGDDHFAVRQVTLTLSVVE